MKIKKIVSTLTAVGLLAASFAACTSKETVNVEKTDGSSFTYWGTLDSVAQSTGITNYADMMFFQELEKRTGVKVNFIHPISGSTGNEAFLTMISAKDRPDMIEYSWENYTGGPQAAIDDEILVCLDEYIKDYAPNFYSYMEGDKAKENNNLWKFQGTTDEGHYYGFNVINIGNTRGFAGFYVRRDKLNEWGMDIPETIDDWTAFFAKAKSEGVESPLIAGNDVFSFKYDTSNGFNTAYGVGKSLYLEGDKVVFAPFEDGYKEYVAQIAQWVKAGYIDTSFPTLDGAKLEGNMANGLSVASWGYVGSGIGKILPAAQAKDPNVDFVACPYPVAEKGQISEFQMMYSEASTTAIGISTTCGNIEKALEWCDYRYGEEGSILQIFGIEGVHHNVEIGSDGEKHYVYTDLIRKPENSGVNSITEALYKYTLPCNYPGLNQHPDYLEGYYPYETQKEAVKTWNISSEAAKLHKLPPLGFSEEELDEITDITEIAEAELEVALTDIMLGRKDIDTFDAAIEKAKAAGYDRVIEINQAAYDRYLAKFN